MWYVYLKESSLDKEIVNICIGNKLHTLEELFSCFIRNNDLKNVSGLSEIQRNELIAFCHDVSAYFEQKLKARVLNKTLRKKPLQNVSDNKLAEGLENMSIDEMYLKKIISRGLYYALRQNGIFNYSLIIKHYSKSKTFYNLRRIGELLNIELLKLISDSINSGLIQPIEVTDDNKTHFKPDDRIDSEVFSKFLENRRAELKKLVVEYFRNLILKSENAESLIKSLNEIYENPGLIKGVDVGRSHQIKKFLNDLKMIVSDQVNFEKFEKECLLNLIAKIASVNINLINTDSIRLDSPISIIDFIITNSGKLKSKHHFVLENVGKLKIRKPGQGLNNKQAREKLCNELDMELTDDAFRTLVSRTRKIIKGLLHTIVTDLDPYIGSLKHKLTLKKEFEIFPTSDLEELNKESNSDFSLIFFDILIRLFNKEYLSVNAAGTRGLTELTYIREVSINDNK